MWHGTEAYGFRGDVWTCGRIAEVLREELGVVYHPGHVSRLLKQLGWTPQLPITRAIQRDEQAIQDWRLKVWPRLKEESRGVAEYDSIASCESPMTSSDTQIRVQFRMSCMTQR